MSIAALVHSFLVLLPKFLTDGNDNNDIRTELRRPNAQWTSSTSLK